jgi:hypothetical protein
MRVRVNAAMSLPHSRSNPRNFYRPIAFADAMAQQTPRRNRSRVRARLHAVVLGGSRSGHLHTSERRLLRFGPERHRRSIRRSAAQMSGTRRAATAFTNTSSYFH